MSVDLMLHLIGKLIGQINAVSIARYLVVYLRRSERMAGLSNRHMPRLCHEHVGMSCLDYNNRLRVCLARELLYQTRLAMERVAERAGFSSSRH
jgi:transcriptional regulator GlxA family with amidase domain